MVQRATGTHHPREIADKPRAGFPYLLNTGRTVVAEFDPISRELNYKQCAVAIAKV